MCELAKQVEQIRSWFPALARRSANGQPVAYLDGAAGTQVPRSVIAAMVDYLQRCNANQGGVFDTSRESDHWLRRAHYRGAELVGAQDAREICFGPNMTTLTFALSRALAKTWQAGDEIVLTRSEHDANFTPWVLAARDAQVQVRYIDVERPTGRLRLDQLEDLLCERTRLIAVGLASNATGTVHPVSEIVQKARAVGALTFVDAVHFAPHRRIDVERLGCDFLVCSSYKFFGPHAGMLWGRYELLDAVPAYKLRPAPERPPGKWMTGTQSHEAIVGTMAAIDYLADLGEIDGSTHHSEDRRPALDRAFARIEQYERTLTARLLERVVRVDGLRVWGIRQSDQLDGRLPTVSFTHPKKKPRQICQELAARGLFAWHGNFYALPLSEAFGLEPDGMVRVGLVHYNTFAEVDCLGDALEEILIRSPT